MALEPPIPGQIPLQPDPAVQEQIPMLPDQTVVPNEENKEGQIIIMKEILDRIDDSHKKEVPAHQFWFEQDGCKSLRTLFRLRSLIEVRRPSFPGRQFFS